MGQITIYLKDELVADVRKRAEAEGKSVSAYVAERLEPPKKREWPPEFLAILGSMPDFPTAEEIRANDPPYVPRDPFE